MVHVEMTPDQARATADDLDLANRIKLGQIDEIAELMSQRRVMVRSDGEPHGFRHATSGEIDEVRFLATRIAAILGHGRGSSFGIGSPAVDLDARRAYEVMKATRKALADHSDPGGRTAHHDGNLVRYTRDPEPVARIREDAA